MLHLLKSALRLHEGSWVSLSLEVETSVGEKLRSGYQKSLGRNMYVHTVQSEKKTKLDTGPRVSPNHGDKTDIKTCCGLPVKHTNLHFLNE